MERPISIKQPQSVLYRGVYLGFIKVYLVGKLEVFNTVYSITLYAPLDNDID